ncbi:hypothetical protein BDV95DRAFT_607989 [Massariosphaeria phaeospora]|uniref:Uncharacterized protein n=1 Tax=Massariosphaeria phaeospora TaxID=100035 RepID=A0A7C8I4U3_9PLEO|nr:hypothetical protein BDV95DRAFT_607989 [Massariosphaeria phaeospora]
MGPWQQRLVFYRDFAYNARRLRMANGNIGHVPAATFAEYVPPPAPLQHRDRASDAASADGADGADDDVELDALVEMSAQRPAAAAAARCTALRPPLVSRLNSHRLHVRAKAKLQRDRLLSGPMLDIYVGPARRHWALHRNLLFHHSEVLEAELQADGGSGSDGKKQPHALELPDHDPAGFELLVKWLYQGQLDDVADLADATQKYDYAVACHKLYLLCDRFDMPQLKNVAMDQYRKGLNQAELVPDADEISDIYCKSPDGSPFRQLMTRIAARQIMDPESHRDVETYRECFQDSPDFAIDLVTAIKEGTGGRLFDDPTDAGNECEYHDHEAGPNCHIKGKGKVKQALKATIQVRDPKSGNFVPSAHSDPHPLPRRPPRLIPNPQPPPRLRQAHPQDGVSAGPLRRRLTSPASSTVETTTENAVAIAIPTSPVEHRDKLRRVTPPEKRRASSTATAVATEESRPAQGDRRRSSAEESRPMLSSSIVEVEESDAPKTSVETTTSPRRGIWDWARTGTGRLSFVGRAAQPEWKSSGLLGSKYATQPTANGVKEDSKASTESLVDSKASIEFLDNSKAFVESLDVSKASVESLNVSKASVESLDDFSIPSTTASAMDPTHGTHLLESEVAAAKAEGLGITKHPVVSPSLFAQTKRSSDDLVASMKSTPSPQTFKNDQWINGMDSLLLLSNTGGSPPGTPSPPQRSKAGGQDAASKNGKKHVSSTRRIPTYKIALAPNLLSSGRLAGSTG